MYWLISVCQSYIDVENEWVSLDIGTMNITLYLISIYGFPNFPLLIWTPSVYWIFGRCPIHLLLFWPTFIKHWRVLKSRATFTVKIMVIIKQLDWKRSSLQKKKLSTEKKNHILVKFNVNISTLNPNFSMFEINGPSH